MSRRRLALVAVLLSTAIAAAVAYARREDRGDVGSAPHVARSTDAGAALRDATGLAAPRTDSAVAPGFSGPVEEPGGVIEGRALHLDGTPWSGGTVTASLVGAPHLQWSARISPDGTFAIRGLDVGQAYRLDAMGEGGRAHTTVAARVAGSGEATTLRVEPPAALVVRVVDEHGEPVANIEAVRLSDGREPGRAGGTSECGVFRFDRVPPGERYVVVEFVGSDSISRPVRVASGRNDVRVAIDLGVRIEGTATDGRGRPADRVRVTAGWIAPPSPGSHGPDRVAEARTILTDADGRFCFARLRREEGLRWRLSVDDENARMRDPVEVVAPAGDVRLVVERAGRVRVRFVDAKGVAVTGDVEVRRERGEELRSTSDRLEGDGLLRLDGFSAATETIEVLAAGFAPVTREVRVPPGDELDLGVITMTSGHRVAGVVVDGRGLPVEGAILLVSHHGRTITDPNGRFAFDGVPPGPLPILVVAERFLRRSLEVTAESSTALRIELSSGAHLEGTVVGADGQGVGGLPVAIVPVEGTTAGEPEASLRTDEDGTFDVRVPPGRYRIEAKEDGAATATLLADLTLADGEERKPTLVFRPR